MKIFLFLMFMGCSMFAVCQHTYLIGSVQMSPFLDQETILPNYEFQVNSRINIGGYVPLYYDSLKSKERLGLDFGFGSFLNSFYYTKSGNENAKITTSINSVGGFFVNIEPYYNLFQSKNNRFKAHVSFNFLSYYYDGSGISSDIEKDSSMFDQSTDKPNNLFQLGVEPSLGISYLFPTASGGLFLRAKGGAVIHNQEVAKLSLSNSVETAMVKMNDYQFTLTVGWLITSKQ